MITSTSSSARFRLVALAALALASGCGRAENAPNDTASNDTALNDTATAPTATLPIAGAAAAVPDRAESPAELYTADLTRAVAGMKKVAFPATAGFGGMTCMPASISGKARALTLTLPEQAAARRHVLAVVTPERGLLEIYSPYGDDAESEDLIVPSQTIAWAKARTQRSFVTTSDALDGLRPGRDTPEALFIEPGRYRFALVNGIDPDLLKANGTPLTVYAACTFDWTP